MRVLTNNYFHKQLEDHGLGEDYLSAVLEDVVKGRSISLGNKLYKIRAAGPSKGKSGGFRNIFFWKKEELIVFCQLFPKSRQDNITPKRSRELTILADNYVKLTDEDVDQLIHVKEFREIKYD